MSPIQIMLWLAVATTPAIGAEIPVTFLHGQLRDQAVVDASDGDRLQITIEDTCPAGFEYSVHGIKKTTDKPEVAGAQAATLVAEEKKALAALLAAACTTNTTQKLPPIFYASDYSGYEVRVTRKANGPGLLFVSTTDQVTPESSIQTGGALRACVMDDTVAPPAALADPKESLLKCLKTKSVLEKDEVTKAKPLLALADRVFVIQVTESDWRYDFSGGVFVSQAVNERYAAVSSGTNQFTIVRNSSGEDDYGTGLGVFVTTSHKTFGCTAGGFCWAPFTFGLGAGNGSDLNVFAGTGMRLGRHAFLTIGLNFAQVETLPGKLNVGDTISDPNALTTMAKKRVVEPFISFSYTFFGDGGATLTKRLAPANGG